MLISCGPMVIAKLTYAPVEMIGHVCRSVGATPERRTGDELDAVLRRFGLRLSLIAEWPRRFTGPRLLDWLIDRPGELIGRRLAVLVEERGRQHGHWIAVGALSAPTPCPSGAGATPTRGRTREGSSGRSGG